MSKKVLIISDKKPGHLNQSIAFCKLKDLEYDILEVSFKLKFFKLFSYIFDQIDIYTLSFFKFDKFDFTQYGTFVSTGSNTYYINKVLAKKYHKSSIVLMLPKSYKYKTFDYIIAQEHDNPPDMENIIKVPLNLSCSEPKSLLKKQGERKSLGLIIGGNNDIFTMDRGSIKKVLDKIYLDYPNYLKYITTSRRTPKEIEELILEYDFDYQVIYSQTPDINPIGDFIDICDELFITIDSTSMLSEARANSDGKINIIALDAKKEDTKFHKLAGIVKRIDGKVDFKKLLQKVEI